MSRVQGARVRAMASSDARVAVETAHAAPPAAEEAPASVLEETREATIRERLGWWREEVGMMTFFLLDPESWR
jgi:hypothetical protein